MIEALTAAEYARFSSYLARVAAATEAELNGILNHVQNPRLHACMRHSLMAGGKRLRPLLVYLGYNLAGGGYEKIPAQIGAAVEMTHTYSLMQDDLPCMDNDVLRRGLPTAHVAFDEYTAILASDALQTGAFEVLAELDISAEIKLELVRLLARASGANGLISGQMLDMMWEKGGRTDILVAELSAMNAQKTGALIEASVLMGAVAGGANTALLQNLATYAQALGRAFQVYDDVLDVVADSAVLGKTAGKDAANGKATFVKFLGLDGAKNQAFAEAKRAAHALEHSTENADMLRLLARYTVTREK